MSRFMELPWWSALAKRTHVCTLTNTIAWTWSARQKVRGAYAIRALCGTIRSRKNIANRSLIKKRGSGFCSISTGTPCHFSTMAFIWELGLSKFRKYLPRRQQLSTSLLLYRGLNVTGKNSTRKILYPMVSSTSTEIELELGRRCSILNSLQDLCLEKIKPIYNGCYDGLPLPKRLIDYLKVTSWSASGSKFTTNVRGPVDARRNIHDVKEIAKKPSKKWIRSPVIWIVFGKF